MRLVGKEREANKKDQLGDPVIEKTKEEGGAGVTWDEFLRYFWRGNFGNSLLQDAANSSEKFMDP